MEVRWLNSLVKYSDSNLLNLDASTNENRQGQDINAQSLVPEIALLNLR